MKDLEKFIANCESNAVPDEKINLSDIPEMTEKDFARGSFKYWKPAKKAISVRLDIDNIAWLKEGGKGYQSRLNKLIRWARQNNCPIANL